MANVILVPQIVSLAMNSVTMIVIVVSRVNCSSLNSALVLMPVLMASISQVALVKVS